MVDITLPFEVVSVHHIKPLTGKSKRFWAHLIYFELQAKHEVASFEKKVEGLSLLSQED